MADVNLDIVRNFFELNGFFVKTGSYLFVKNPEPRKVNADSFLLNAETVTTLQSAIVSIKPWHSEALFPSRINSFPELFKFLDRKALDEAREALGNKSFQKVLVVSKLPSTKQTLRKSADILKSRGVDSVLQFPEILRFLIKQVRTNVNYTENDILQILRILKCCGFFGVGQLELFKK